MLDVVVVVDDVDVDDVVVAKFKPQKCLNGKSVIDYTHFRLHAVKNRIRLPVG
jgi:hypothetical protein